ncbi:MAG: outer membrane lipoprotein-sorting protein [Spirochaetales bacterium]|nr:outer membrane lipoprotein-sorting protein [Spirochaetales bacterium]
MKHKIFIPLFLIMITSLASAAETPDFKAILELNDQRQTFENQDFSATITFISVDPEEGDNKSTMVMFRNDDDDKFLLLTLEPVVDKGVGILRVDDNLWQYDPESRKFTHTSLKDMIQGTDARNSDMRVSTLSEDYEVTAYEEGKLGAFDVWIVTLNALNDEVTYPKQIVYINKENNLILQAKEYSLTGRLMRSKYTPKYEKINNKFVATTILIVDELVKGKKTQITFKDISLKDIPEEVFSKNYLERVNR